MKYLDYYAILELPHTAPRNEVKRSFRSLAKEYHPDKCGNTAASQILFRSILEAYKVLSDTKSRQIYDSYINNSSIIKTLISDPREKGSLTLVILKSQLNYILWELEDLLKEIRTSMYRNRDKSRMIETSLMDLLTDLDRNVLSPSGQGDHYFSARKLEISEPYTPISRNLTPEHSPYTGIEDYFFQIRKRTNLFIEKVNESEITSFLDDQGTTLMDRLYEFLQKSFSILGKIASSKYE